MPSVFQLLDAVVLKRDLPELGLLRGDLGAVVHVHSVAAFEVEFVRASGCTHAVVSVEAGDIRAVGGDDVHVVRAVGR